MRFSSRWKTLCRWGFGLTWAISQAQALLQAKGRRLVARGGLLPNVNAAVSEEFEKLNLRTQGVESSTFAVTAEFNFFDARAARLNQSIFDLVKIENLHSASDTLRASLNWKPPQSEVDKGFGHKTQSPPSLRIRQRASHRSWSDAVHVNTIRITCG
jgi:hypothetical protein